MGLLFARVCVSLQRNTNPTPTSREEMRWRRGHHFILNTVSSDAVFILLLQLPSVSAALPFLYASNIATAVIKRPPLLSCPRPAAHLFNNFRLFAGLYGRRDIEWGTAWTKCFSKSSERHYLHCLTFYCFFPNVLDDTDCLPACVKVPFHCEL